MTINETMNFIHSPRWIGAASNFSRMEEMLGALSSPQKALRFVHVAGTNGKGSVCAMIESVLREAGYKTGLYTSPYIHEFSERIRVGGEYIPDAALSEIVEELAPVVDALASPPPEFEIITVIALCHFARSGCDIVVLETGIGGRLDPTNVIAPPECAVITAIGLDHTEILGDTIGQIAAEKAGIIKSGSPVVAYDSSDEAMAAIKKACDDKGARLRVADFGQIELMSDSLAGQAFRYKGSRYFLSLLGIYQLKNAAVAIEALETLGILPNAIRNGLAKARHMARFELAGGSFVIDGGHNVQGVNALRESILHYFPDKKAVVIMGIMRGKDAGAMVGSLAPCAECFVCVRPDNPRAIAAEGLAEIVRAAGGQAKVCGSVEDAIDTARSLAGTEKIICAAGSLYLAGEVRACLKREGKV